MVKPPIERCICADEVEKVSGATEKVWKGTRKVKAEKAKERGRATRKVNGASGKAGSEVFVLYGFATKSMRFLCSTAVLLLMQEEEEMRKERANSAMTARAFTQAKACILDA